MTATANYTTTFKNRLLAIAGFAAVLEITAMLGFLAYTDPLFLLLRIAETTTLGIVLLITRLPYSRHVGLAMLASAAGDANNTGLTGITWIDPYLLQSIPLFAIAHLIYIRCFLNACGAAAGGAAKGLAVAGLLALIPWALTRNPDAATAVQIATAGYALVIGMMLGAAVLLWRHRPHCWPVALGALLFVASDLILAVFWLGPDPNPDLVRLINWWVYFPAQCLIALLPLRMLDGERHVSGD